MSPRPCQEIEPVALQAEAVDALPAAVEALPGDTEQLATQPIIVEDGAVATVGVAVAAYTDPVNRRPLKPENWTPDKHALVNALYADPEVQAMARRYVSGYIGGDTGDLLNETFMRIARSSTEVDLSQAGGLVRVAMQSVVRDSLRRTTTLMTDEHGKARVAKEVQVELWDLPESPQLIQADQADAVVDDATLGQMLGHLSKGERRVVYALYVEDLTMATAAKKLDLSLSAVKSRSRDALGRLRRILAPDVTS